MTPIEFKTIYNDFIDRRIYSHINDFIQLLDFRIKKEVINIQLNENTCIFVDKSIKQFNNSIYLFNKNIYFEYNGFKIYFNRYNDLHLNLLQFKHINNFTKLYTI